MKHQQVNDSLAMNHSYCLKTGWNILVVNEMVTKKRRNYRKNNKFWKFYQLGSDILRNGKCQSQEISVYLTITICPYKHMEHKPGDVDKVRY
jgi:hypothetical protein